MLEDKNVANSEKDIPKFMFGGKDRQLTFGTGGFIIEQTT